MAESPSALAESAHRALSALLGAAEDETGGDRLYDAYAPGALLLFEGRLTRRDQIDRAAFASAHAAAARTHADEHPDQPRGPSFSDLRLTTFTPEPDGRAVAWFEATALPWGQAVHLAAGFEPSGAGWLIDWMSLDKAPQPLGYARGRLMAASEFSFGLATWLHLPRTMLDAAYFRLYRRDNAELLTLPGARFGCHGSGTCCRFDYDIVLPEAAQGFIDAMPWEAIAPELAGTQLETRPDGTLQLKRKGEACRFLDEHRHCMIHKHVGRQVFSSCAVYPFSFADTPEGVAVSMSFICGSARNQLGPPLTERADDLYFRLSQMGLHRTDAYRLAPGLVVSWELFRDAEQALRDLLDRKDLPLMRRLWLSSRLLEEALQGRGETLPEWEVEPLKPMSAPEREVIGTLIGKMLTWERAALKPLAGRPLGVPRHEALREPEVFARLAQNLHFSKTYSYPYDLVTAHNLTIMLYLLALHLEDAYPAGMPDTVWEELGALGTHNLLQSLFNGESDPFRLLMGGPGMGLWLLRYPEVAPVATGS